MILFNKNIDYYFSIFNKNNCLYIKNNLNNIQKISNNIYLYSALIDNSNQIHICFINYKNYIYYYTYSNDSLNLIFSTKININYNKICKFSIYLLKDSINILFSKSTDKNYHNILHLNYNFNNHNLTELKIGTAYKYKKSLYNMIKSNNNLICSYYIKTNNIISLESMTFNDHQKKWNTLSNIRTSNILFNYCNTIKY